MIRNPPNNIKRPNPKIVMIIVIKSIFISPEEEVKATKILLMKTSFSMYIKLTRKTVELIIFKKVYFS